MSKYTWVVTRDSSLGDSSEAVGKVGPTGARDRERFDVVILKGDHFRMLDEQGRPQFSGYIIGEFEGHEPLEDYGRENGCVAIQYQRDGEWVAP